MTRLIAIPILGTALALVVIRLAHAPPEPAPEPEAPGRESPAPGRKPAAAAKPEPKSRPRATDTAPRAGHYELRVDQDGSFHDLDSGAAYPDADELIKGLGKARHTLVLTNGPGVDEAALDEALAGLRDRYVVRKIYRAPQEEGK